jgi:regulator of cell morphogenesis and NO signaling
MNASSKIGEIVALAPSAISVFEQLGIDCYGMAGRPLNYLCSAQGLSGESVLRSVEEGECAACAVNVRPDWMVEPLFGLIEHIVQRHHRLVRDLFSQLHAITDSSWERHRRSHPELAKLKSGVQLLERELLTHLRKEEDTVFPHIRTLERQTEPEAPDIAFFRSVSRPVNTLMSVMSGEHDLTDYLLQTVIDRSKVLEVPDVDFEQFRELLQSLKRDLLVHSCLEDYILFPRARNLETNDTACLSDRT